MLNIQLFTFNPFQENTYLIINENSQCWIVDPGMYYEDEISELTSYIDNQKLIPQSIINTHTHIDHIFGVQALIDKYNIPFGMHEKDMPVVDSAKGSAALFGFRFDGAPKPSFFISEHTPLVLGTDVLEVRFTPGHSPGSVVFYYAAGQWVVGGDVLFAGGIGRTDLPGGNTQTLLDRIRTQLFTLPGNTTVYPGHGPSTTIAHEMDDNPFLQGS